LLAASLILFVSIQAPTARDTYARAVALEESGNHPAALVLLWEAAGLAPGDADVQNRLGEALDRIGALDAAIDAFRRALDARPSFRRATNNLILTLVKAGRGPDAVARAGALARAAPDDPESHFTLGLAQSEQDVEGAVASFRRAIALSPGHVLARYNLALVLKRVDRLPEALSELDAAIRIEPRPEAHYTIGVIHWHRGDLDRAASALRAAIAANPAYADAHYTLGAVLHAQRDWPGAAAALRRAIELRPDLWSAHYTLGRVLQGSGDEHAARDRLATAERLRQRARLEHEASVATSVGTARLDAGDPKGALEQFRRATALYEAYAPAHYQMGRALQRLGEHTAARAAFHRAQQLNPSLLPPR
jgi:tetratricopeptide (TPR) repeat protein